MTFSVGRVPESKSVRAVSAGTTAIRHGLIFVSSVLIAFNAMAQQTIPLTLAEAEDRAMEAEPGQEAMRAKAEALRERGVVTAELPDPMLRLSLNNYPIQSGGFSTEGMTSAGIGWRQVFPAGETRAIGSRQFDFLADEMNQSAAARGRNVLTATRQAWLDLYYWEQAYALINESRPFFGDLATVTRSLYAVGRKSQQDVLRAELELSRLDDRLIDVERQRARSVAMLREWIGDDATRPVAKKLPAWVSVPTIETLQSQLMQHPSMQAVDAQIQAHSAGVELAEQRTKAGWALDVGYSYREGSLASGEPRSDFVSVGVTFDLPFFRRTSTDSTLTAALKERSAARSGREQIQRQLTRQLESEYAHWRDLNRRLELYETQILSQASDNADASMSAYQSDRGDFADVMRAYIDDLNTRIDHIRLQVERAQSYAALDNLGGITQ
jgi:outer membrane protein TolC